MLERRALYRTAAGAPYRLLDAFPERDKPVVYLFSIDGKNPRPLSVPLDEFKEDLRSGAYVKLKTTAAAPVVVKPAAHPTKSDKAQEADNKTLSPTEALHKWRWDLIKPLVENELIYVRKQRGRLMAERAQETGASEQTIWTCLRLYWRGGMTYDALMPDFRFSGTPKASAQGQQQAVRGRKPRGYETFNWTDEVKTRVVRALRAVLKKNPKATQPLLYRRVVLKIFSTQVVEEIKGKQKTVVKQLPMGERPSRAQLYYLIDKTFSLEERLRQRHGDHNFDNNFAPKTGSARQHAAFAGNIYEIDSTIVDCWIVDDDDPHTVIGKATLYLVIDVFTKLIAGFHLTLDSPSWSGAMEALLSLVEDKAKLCEKWGHEYLEQDWPAHGVMPAFIRTDRGSDFTAYASDVLTDGLGIHYVKTERLRSTKRGTVECGHKLVQAPIRENVGGYTPPEEFGKRRVSDHRDEAYRTMKSLGSEVLAGILLNNRKAHRRTQLPAAAIWANEQPIPTRMWRLSSERVGIRSTYEEPFMRFKLLPVDDALSVTPRGVFRKGLLYLPDKSLESHWLLRATKGFYKVTATFDRRSVATIYVHDKKDPTKWTTMSLSPEYAHHQGRSWGQFEALKVKKLTLDDLAEEHNLALELQNDFDAEQREEESRGAAQNAIKAAKKKSRTADTTVKRNAAIDKEHAAVPVLPTSAIPAPPPTPRAQPTQLGTAPTPRPSAPASATGQPKLASTTANSKLQALLNLKAKA